MKLWKATIEVEVLLAHEHEPSDYEIRDAARESMMDSDPDCWAQEITTFDDLPDEWLGAIPYGDSDDMKCEQILEARIAQLKAEAWKRPMPNQTSLPLEDA